MQRRSQLIFAFACVITLTLATFAPGLNFDFINFDDNVYITENPPVLAGLSAESIHWAFTKAHAGMWHPLTWLSHMLDIELFGLDPWGHHLVNIILHSISAGLLLCLAFELGMSLPIAMVVALIFAVHPLRLESVVWMSERKDTLSICLGLLTLLLWLRATSVTGRTLSCLCYILALLAKPSVIVLPGLMYLLQDWHAALTFKLSSVWKFVRENAAFFLAALCVTGFAFWSQDQGGALKSLSGFDLPRRIDTAALAICAYLGQLVWPSNTALFFPYQSYLPGIGIGVLIVLGGLTALLWRQQSAFPELLRGWLFYLLALLPVMGLVQIGGQALAHRYSYLAHIGILLGLGAMVQRMLSRPSAETNLSRALPWTLLFIPLVFGLQTQRLLPHWQDSRSIFEHTLNVWPDNFMAQLNLGVALEQTTGIETALPHYQAAVQLSPQYPAALNSLGSAYAKLGRYQEAIEVFTRILKRHPDHSLARYNLGLTYSHQGAYLHALDTWLPLIQTGHSAAEQSSAWVLNRLPPEQGCLLPKGSHPLRHLVFADQHVASEELRAQWGRVFACDE